MAGDGNQQHKLRLPDQRIRGGDGAVSAVPAAADLLASHDELEDQL